MVYTYVGRKSLFLKLLLVCRDIERYPGPQYFGLQENTKICYSKKGINLIRDLQGNFDEIHNILVNQGCYIACLSQQIYNFGHR